MELLNMQSDEFRELLIGCGRSRVKRLGTSPTDVAWNNLTTLDNNPDHKPDCVWDLEKLPLPFMADVFDEIHAYEVLEHTGTQGDYRFFFKQFSDFWRILKPGGILFATVPSLKSVWAWGDPSHTRVITLEQLGFLHQPNYTANIGKTTMSDFRHIYKADFTPVLLNDNGESFVFALKAEKPSRITEN